MARKPDGDQAEYCSDGLRRMGICAICTVEPYTVKIIKGSDFDNMYACMDCASQVVEDL